MAGNQKCRVCQPGVTSQQKQRIGYVEYKAEPMSLMSIDVGYDGLAVDVADLTG